MGSWIVKLDARCGYHQNAIRNSISQMCVCNKCVTVLKAAVNGMQGSLRAIGLWIQTHVLISNSDVPCLQHPKLLLPPYHCSCVYLYT
jgi:hypothetical protein